MFKVLQGRTWNENCILQYFEIVERYQRFASRFSKDSEALKT